MITSNFFFTAVKTIFFIYISFSQCLLTVGLKLAYDEIEPPGGDQEQKAPIIMMHGLTSWRKEWKYVAPDIAKNTGRKIYAIDARNHGDSPWSQEHNVQVMMDDLDEFLNDHNISKAILVGLSMGGKTALSYALNKPEIIEKIVVEEMKVDNITRKEYKNFRNLLLVLDDLLKQSTEGATLLDAKEAIYRSAEVVAKKMFKMKDFDWDLIPIKEENNTYTWKSNFDLFLTMNYEDVVGHMYPNVYMGDALFIYGKKSMLHIANDKMILRFFPRAKLLEWDSALHILHYQFPERFIQAVSNFINDNE